MHKVLNVWCICGVDLKKQQQLHYIQLPFALELCFEYIALSCFYIKIQFL